MKNNKMALMPLIHSKNGKIVGKVCFLSRSTAAHVLKTYEEGFILGYNDLLSSDLYGIMGDPVSASEYYQLHNSLTKQLLESK